MNFLTQMKEYFKVSWQRLLSNTPKYWNNIFKLGLALTALSLFLTENDSLIPEEYKYITKYITVAASAIAAVSKLATTNEILAAKTED